MVKYVYLFISTYSKRLPDSPLSASKRPNVSWRLHPPANACHHRPQLSTQLSQEEHPNAFQSYQLPFLSLICFTASFNCLWSRRVVTQLQLLPDNICMQNSILRKLWWESGKAGVRSIAFFRIFRMLAVTETFLGRGGGGLLDYVP